MNKYLRITWRTWYRFLGPTIEILIPQINYLAGILHNLLQMLLLCQGRFLLLSFPLHARVLSKSKWATVSLCHLPSSLYSWCYRCNCCLPRTLRSAWHCVQCCREGRSCILCLEAVFCLPSPLPTSPSFYPLIFTESLFAWFPTIYLLSFSWLFSCIYCVIFHWVF